MDIFIDFFYRQQLATLYMDLFFLPASSFGKISNSGLVSKQLPFLYRLASGSYQCSEQCNKYNISLPFPGPKEVCIQQ